MTEKPILYYAIRSPPCRAVLMTAAAIGLELDLRVPILTDPKISKINPRKTVPILDDNGTIVNDSHVIDTYLVGKYASDDTLYPKDPQKRREIDAALYYDACHLFPRARFLHDTILYNGAHNYDEFNIKHLQMSYDLLEDLIGDSPYLCGDQITIADFHAVTSVTSGMLCAPLIDEKHPKIKAWINRLSLLPYYKINEDGLEDLVDFTKRKIEDNLKAKATL